MVGVFALWYLRVDERGDLAVVSCVVVRAAVRMCIFRKSECKFLLSRGHHPLSGHIFGIAL